MVIVLCLGVGATIVYRVAFADNVLESTYAACESRDSNTKEWARLGDDGATLIVDGADVDTADGQDANKVALCLMDETHMPDAVKNHVGHTRALDGTQTDSWDDLNVRWTYHPDNGLDMTYTIK